jgi:nucleoside-diphosphate-sugar epimerase
MDLLLHLQSSCLSRPRHAAAYLDFLFHNMKRWETFAIYVHSTCLRVFQLRNSVTTIIHNAWRLDFNLSLSSFEPNVRGTRHLIDLALATPHATHVRMLFTSSVSVAQSWPRGGESFPEEPQDDARWSVGSGYREAKYVCEQVASLLELPFSIL